MLELEFTSEQKSHFPFLIFPPNHQTWYTHDTLNIKQDPREATYTQLDAKSKRPFCNAFTGCGKKRSNEVVPPMLDDDSDQRMVSEMVEMNSEPAIENVMRQIMSEAKMYEALQEANREMYLQKLRHNGYSGGYSPQRYGYPTTFSTQ